MVVDHEAATPLRDEMGRNGAYFLSEGEAKAVAGVLVGADLHVNPKLVGKPAEEIAGAAGVEVPPGTRCLIAKLEVVGPSEPLSIEKLSPVLAWYEVSDWQEGCERCKEILRFGGMGHTLAIHCNDEEIITAFGLEKPASRICVNTPASHGAVGYSTSLPPSFTLGCGAGGNNITSDNITPLHLIDIKRIAYETREVIPTWVEAADTAGGENMESLPPPSSSDRAVLEKLVDEFLTQRNGCSIKPQPTADEPTAVEQPPVPEADNEEKETTAAAPPAPAAPLPPGKALPLLPRTARVSSSTTRQSSLPWPANLESAKASLSGPDFGLPFPAGCIGPGAVVEIHPLLCVFESESHAGDQALQPSKLLFRCPDRC